MCCTKRRQYDIYEGGVCEYEVCFARLSDFSQYVSNFLKTSVPLQKFFSTPDLSNPHFHSVV